MPEFRLDFPKQPPLPPLKRTFITKNEYNSAIKVTDWDRGRESEPKDFDPYNPPGGNQHRSSYNRFGNDREEWFTETQRMLAQCHMKPNTVEAHAIPIVSYGNYKETSIPEEDIWKMTPQQCYTDYQSTMKASYKMPLPYVMQPLCLPKPPYLQNRRLLFENPFIETNKYLDDCRSQRVSHMQEVKKPLHKSFNPCTCKYSDGTELPVIKRKYYDLPYSHVD